MTERLHYDLCYEVKSWKTIGGRRVPNECHLVEVNGHPVKEELKPGQMVDLTQFPYNWEHDIFKRLRLLPLQFGDRPSLKLLPWVG